MKHGGRVSYRRIFAADDGESHFDRVAVELTETEFAPPAPPLDVSEPCDAKRFVFVGGPAGWNGDWHPSPKRQIVVCLSGRFELTVSDGEAHVLRSGDVALLEDTTGKGHKTRIIEKGLTAVVQLE